MSITATFLPGLTVLNRGIDDIPAVALPFHAHGGGAASVQIEGVLRIEPLDHESGELTGGEAGPVGLASIHHEQDQVLVLRKADGRAGMAHPLMTLQIL